MTMQALSEQAEYALFAGNSWTPNKTGGGESKSAKVFFYSFNEKPPVAPANSQFIGDLVEELSRDSAKAAALQRARQRLGAVSRNADSMRSLRLNRGLSQVELARQIGSSQSHVARMERGNRQVQLDTCARLATALDVEIGIVVAAIFADAQRAEAQANG